MAEKKDLRAELANHYAEFGFIQANPCSNEENEKYNELLKNGGTLPENVRQYDGGYWGEFCTISKTDLTEEEKREYITFKQLSLLKTIKNCAVFFTVLTIIDIVAALLLILL